MTLLKHIVRSASALAYLAFAATVLLSCNDENEQKPIPEPEPEPETSITEMTIDGLTANARVWNKITLKLGAVSEAGIEKIELKVDQTAVASLTAAPFDFELNTKDLSEGVHTLSVTASAKDGTRKTIDMPFSVQNVLLHIDVPADFLQNGARGFIFLSDSLGKTIVAQEYQAGDSLILLEPSYTKGTFTLTQGYIDAGGFQYLFSYTDVPRGRWALIARYDDGDQAKHEINFNLTRVTPGGQYQFSTNAGVSWYSNYSDGTQSVAYINDDSKLFIGFSPGGSNTPITQYLYFPSIVAQPATIDLAAAKPMTQKQFSMAGFEYASYMLYGVSQEGSYQLDEVQGEDDSLYYRYPGDAFPQYLVATTLAKEGRYFANITTGEPSLATINGDIQATFTDNTFTGATSGPVDYCNYEINGDYVYWSIFTHAGAQHIKLPEIPALLTGHFVDDFSNAFINVSACDASAYDGYDNFIRIFSEFPGDAIRDYMPHLLGQQVFTEIRVGNGRLSAPANRQTTVR